MSFFVLALDQDSGGARQVPCFGQDPNIWLQGRHVSWSWSGLSLLQELLTVQTVDYIIYSTTADRLQLHFPGSDHSSSSPSHTDYSFTTSIRSIRLPHSLSSTPLFSPLWIRGRRPSRSSTNTRPPWNATLPLLPCSAPTTVDNPYTWLRPDQLLLLTPLTLRNRDAYHRNKHQAEASKLSCKNGTHPDPH